MKKIKFMIVSLVAILGFNSCSNEFDFTDEKKLTRYTCVIDGDFKHIDRSFEYNKKGRLISAYEEQFFKEDTYGKSSYTYNWNKKGVDVFVDNFIKLNDTEETNTSINFTITLEKKLFAKFVYDKEYKKYNYTYDSEGRLKRYRASVSDVTFEWEGDKLVSTVDVDIDANFKYKYGNISCVKGYCPIIVWENTQEMITLAHPEHAGLRTIHCPVSVDYDSEFLEVSYNYTYEYEFDEEGYITKIIETRTEKINNEETTNSKIYTYTLTWE